MKVVFPDYYDDFKCTASACRHNCCIGWEIDIDDESLARYRSVGGEFGKRLKKNIARRPTAHFILGENERCPFLNDCNLCDIYSELGEDALCQICADHPRFRNFYSNSTEIGLGLCCEAVSALVLSREEPVRFLFSEDDEEGEKADELEKAVLKTKYDLLGLLQNRSISLYERVEKALAMCAAELPKLKNSELARFFLSLERLDEKWTEVLGELIEAENVDFEGFGKYAEEFMREYEQLAVYFVYRHMGAQIFDGCIAGAMGLAAVSLQLLYAIGAMEYTKKGSFEFDERCELVRLYSAEIEYSQENIDALWDAFAGE
ncbi:MAG: flagellin lysine-N-methylase [Oscillospiraceae bacterium]|nr:flagellin lysine-N-methylase [Oscillospiraceae bacterium]